MLFVVVAWSPRNGNRNRASQAPTLCERRQPFPAAVTLSPAVIAVKGPPTAHCAVAVGKQLGPTADRHVSGG